MSSAGPPSASPQPPRGKPRPLAKVLAIFISVAIAILGLEILCALYYGIKDGKFISVRDRMASEKNAYLEELLPKNTAYVDLLFPHPYLSYVYKPGLPNPGMPINREGFLGPEFPREKEPGVFVILVTGGSVANQFAGLSEDRNILEQALNRDYTNDTIRKFVVLNGAAGAWRQPQQLIMLELYAHLLDGIINLDGFNEREHLQSAFKFGYPADNYLATMAKQVGFSGLVWPLWLDGKLLRLERDVWPFNRSFCVYMTASNVRRAARNYYHRRTDRGPSRSLRNTIDRLFLLPKDWSPEKKTDLALRQYQNCLRMMHAVATSMKVKDLYVIQPVPALLKELTPEESRVVGDLSYRDLYQTMADRLLELKSEAVPVFSLLDVFKDKKETLYQDAVHVSPQGNQMMVQRILPLLETEWHLARNGAGGAALPPASAGAGR